jgi:hypothetical protein
VAVWQADFAIALPTDGLPLDYPERFAAVLPPGRSWSPRLETWGQENSDRLDLWWSDDDCVAEMSARFDLRTPNPGLYEAFISLLASFGGELRAEDGEPVAVEQVAFLAALRRSPAFRFASDPEGYLTRVRASGVEGA